ncbi:Aste57867_109 [Aphanomyces stellatus]|uniref:Aste57867_109 protein n=1 Tax=Aphanomyces stellatus TaxID=120398 RepID=A0A485K6R5_9STRA|nr:hypothetical protein As57867_000109 [Aphanomyces stellatus]VFT77335.1 Aste57867_109 [Aphanomyces stellatus]
MEPPLPQTFHLSPTSVLVISIGDITTWKGDAIVNAAHKEMLGGGGVDGAIHHAAGPGLLRACQAVRIVSGRDVRRDVRCPTGEARLTRGFRLPAAHVIHAVGPVYSTKSISEPLLIATYQNSLQLAMDRRFQTIAFPAISCGAYKYPVDDAAVVALSVCLEATSASSSSLQRIEFVMFETRTFEAWVHAAANELQLTRVDHNDNLALDTDNVVRPSTTRP